MWQRSKRVLFLAALTAYSLSLATHAAAGDRALADVIGYSEDGRYFAFEEFGIEDGSGFAYSNTYIIDLTEDRWVVGTPINLRADDESEALHALRSRARAAAEPRLADLAIDLPAQAVAVIGDGAIGTDGKSLSFGLPGTADTQPGSVSGRYEAILSVFDTEAGAPCADWFGAIPKGFSLKVGDSGPAREVHRDGVLPRSRGCPVDYRIFGVFLPFNATDISRAAALVSVYVHGFEGPDRRFIAVPLAFTF